MAEDEKWVIFDDDDDEDDKLSLCDLPVAINDGNQEPKKKQEESDPLEDFEFRTCDGGDFEFRTCGGGGDGLMLKADEPEMCSADEVFSGGQLLPLRPSVSSEWVPSRCGSRSESMDRRSLGFATSRSGSSSSSGSRSTSSISRSHSSNSFSSAGGDQPSRLSVSNNFYAHPSPTPVLQARRKSTGRRSTGSSPPGWGLFRLGVVKVPEIELYDLRSRQASSKRSDLDSKQEKIAERAHEAKDGNGCQRDGKNEKKVTRFLGRGFGCSCSPDAATQGAVIARKKKEEREKPSLKRGESTCRSRIFEWLDELSVSKGSSMG